MDNIRYRLVSSLGEIVFCNLTISEIGRIHELVEQGGIIYINGVKYRAGYSDCDYGRVIAFTCYTDYLKSSRKFRGILDVIKNALRSINLIFFGIKNQVNDDTKRLLHNLVSLNAHNIQEIYSLVPQDNLADKKSGHIEMITGIVKANAKDVAISLLKIMKNNISMKTEFSVFRKLFDDNPNLDKREHHVHKVLMNVFYLFFSDFTDKNVEVDIKLSKLKASFDYESVHVALYYIIENATKYTLPNTVFSVDFQDCDSMILISFAMKSIQVKSHEVHAIFEEGYSGEIPRKIGKSGEGIGMSRVRRIVLLNKGDVSFSPDFNSYEDVRGIPYQQNTIKLFLPKK